MSVSFAFLDKCSIFGFVFYLLTTPFHIFLLSILIYHNRKSKSELNTTFFKLCISAGIIDIVVMSNSYFCNVFPKWGWFRDFYLAIQMPWMRCYFFIGWAAGVCQALSASVFAFNRLTAVLMPDRYNRIWSNKAIWIAICIQYVPGMVIASATFWNPPVVDFDDNGGGLVPRLTDAFALNIYFIIGAILYTANSIFLISAYSIIFKAFRRQQKNLIVLTNAPSKSSRQSERRLLAMSAIICLIQLSIALFLLRRMVKFLNVDVEVFYAVNNMLSDIYSGANPYLLWIFCPPIRNHVLRLLRLTKDVSQQMQFQPSHITATRRMTQVGAQRQSAPVLHK